MRASDMDPTHTSLLERLKLPVDQKAWSRFVDLYTPLLYSWARQLGLQEADAADNVAPAPAAAHGAWIPPAPGY
jgi:hypothetical protein